MTPIAQNQIAAPQDGASLGRLIDTRDELRSQLQAAMERRHEIASQLLPLSGDAALRAGPMARLETVDRLIARLEGDIAKADEYITAAKAKGIESGEPAGRLVPDAPSPPGFPSLPSLPGEEFSFSHETSWRDQFEQSLPTVLPISLATVVLLGAFLYWRISRSMKNQFAQLLAMHSGRLEELQRSVDSVAVEMERVSENQRFVTKLVGEKPPVERR